MFRKLIAICFGVLITAQVALAFTDTQYDEHRNAIDILQEHQIVQGYDDGTFRPSTPINRAEFLKILMLAVFDQNAYDALTTHRCFSDFFGEEQWFWIHACAAKAMGIVQGHPDGTFRGTNTINLAEALKMTIEAFDIPLPRYVRAPDNWYDPYMDAAFDYSVFSLVPFRPAHELTRGEMAAIIVAISGLEKSGQPVSSQGTTTTVTFPPTNLPVCGNGVLEEGEYCDDGNTENGDGCSSLCIIVAEPVRHGALRIEQRTIADDEQSAGSEGVPLLRFDAIAGRQDVYITTLKFRSAAGSLDNADNYEIYIDRDGDNIPESLYGRAVNQGEELVFGNLSILVKDGEYRRVELRGDLVNTNNALTIAVGFDTTQSDFIEGVDRVDGEDVSGIRLNDDDCQLVSICWIRVLIEDAYTVNVTTKGNLYVTEDSMPVPSRQVLAGALSDALLRLKVRAESEPILITKVTVGGGTASIDRLELYEDGQNSALAVARESQCDTVITGQFCTDDDILIPKDSEMRMLIKAFVSSENDGAVSAQTVALTLTPSTSGTVAFEAEGYSSAKVLAQNDSDGTAEGEIFIGRSSAGVNNTIAGPTHDIVFSKIVSIVNAHPDVDGTNVPTADATIARFRFTAAAHNNSKDGLNAAVIDKLIFTVSAVSVQVDSGSFELYNPENASVVASCSASGTTGSIFVTCQNLEASSVSTVIEQGSTVDLSLRTTVVNPKMNAGSSTLQVALQALGNRSDTTTVHWSDEENTFQWVDIGTTNVKSVLYRTD